MAKYQAESIWIASMWPGKLEPITLYHGPDPDPRTRRATVYHIKPIKRGSRPPYKLLEVSDAFENIPDPLNGEGGRVVWVSRPVPCEDIVADLLKRWAGNRVGIPAGASPGIMRIANSVPMQAELDQMMSTQLAFAEFQFQEAERMDREKDWKGITQDMKDCAKWLGRERLWSSPELAGTGTDCPACKQPIPEEAFVCFHCGTKIKAFSPELASLNAGPDLKPAA